MTDRYDSMSDAEIRAQAKVRGIPEYRIEHLHGSELRAYMRDFDLDEEDVARWDPA